jgi:hypothetical protein
MTIMQTTTHSISEDKEIYQMGLEKGDIGRARGGGDDGLELSGTRDVGKLAVRVHPSVILESRSLFKLQPRRFCASTKRIPCLL